jgi:hypothetical protein
MGTWLVALAAAVTVTGCGQTLKEFACGPEKSCGPGGTCETSGFCSFEDSSCPSGRRYGDLGGPSGDCTPGGGPQQQVDAAIDGPPDGRPDAPPDAMEFCYGAAPFTICLLAAPNNAIDIGQNTTIDTGTGVSTGTPNLTCAPTFRGGDGYCVLVAKTISISSTLRATGSKPLVLLAADSITTTGQIDVASHRTPAESIGAGADPGGTACPAGVGPMTNGTSGGGAGGSFNGLGGGGGIGGNAGGTGGTPGASTAVVNVIRGGCAGQDGAGSNKGLRGHGGGAVFLLAGNTITVNSIINAGGEGGGGAATNDSGGGGGGAGGMIGFDAPNINVGANVIANGGAGGEGSGSTTQGASGADSTTKTAAQCGNSSNGGDGGNGSAGPAAGPGAKGADDLNAVGGGGGGGGGAGIIKGPVAALNGQTSPAPTP